MILASIQYTAPSIISVPVLFALLIGIIIGMVIMARRR